MSELIDGELALIDCELAHDAKLCSCDPAAGHPRQVGVGLPRTLLDRHGSSHPLSRAAAIAKELRAYPRTGRRTGCRRPLPDLPLGTPRVTPLLA
jgi:hypothetical protein